jgi:hypothetical protein
MESRLEAAAGLTLVLDDPEWRLEWNEADWLGPVRIALPGGEASAPEVAGAAEGQDDIGAYRVVEIASGDARIRATVRAYDEAPLLVFRLEATVDLAGLGGTGFAAPVVTWPQLLPARRRAGGIPTGSRTYGHQYTEFALPVNGSDTATGFLFAPHRPAVVEPLLFIAPDGRVLMLAPLDRFHEQIIAVPADSEHEADGIRCGWHGDLAEAPAGFATDLAVWAAPSPRAALEQWAALLRRRAGTRRRGRYADDGVGKLSYWTDNGAVYYYRTAPGCDYTATLEGAIADLHQQDVPVRAAQIDSWFYPHFHLREVGPEGAPLVPPSGMMTWEPREDLFPEGFRDLRRRLGGLPLTFHSRHFSSQSPYFREYEAWVDGDYAHPKEPRLFTRLMESAASWGAITYEQDWMVESFLGVRGLRAAPGRARAWQEGLDRAAGDAGLTLQWCMSTPADFMQTTTLDNLTSIRTSGDYRYLFDNGLNWVWFLHTNAFARALGLVAYKDVFLSHRDSGAGEGEPYAEVEALLAALSAGPVGIGDEIGRADRDLVMRTCREDGVLVKPDAPVAAIDRCFAANCFLEPNPLIGETYSEHPAGRWLYLAVFHACRVKEPMRYRVSLSDLGAVAPAGPVILFDWRRRTCERLDAGGGWSAELPWQDWDYRVVCPILPGEITVFGDVSKYATAGDRRVAAIRPIDGGVAFDVLGVPGTEAEIWGWAARRPEHATSWDDGGIWRLRVAIESPVTPIRLAPRLNAEGC